MRIARHRRTGPGWPIAAEARRPQRASRSSPSAGPELDLRTPETHRSHVREPCARTRSSSAAAYTAVDKAESEPELAFAVNATGAGPCSPRRPRSSACRSSTSRPTMSSTATRPAPTSKSDRDRRRSASMAARSWRASRRSRRQPRPRHPAHRLGLLAVRRQFRQDDAARLAETRDQLRVVDDQPAARPPRSISPTRSLRSRPRIVTRPRRRSARHLSPDRCGRGELGGFRRGDLRRAARIARGRTVARSRRSRRRTIRRRRSGRPIRGSTARQAGQRIWRAPAGLEAIA